MHFLIQDRLTLHIIHIHVAYIGFTKLLYKVLNKGVLRLVRGNQMQKQKSDDSPWLALPTDWSIMRFLGKNLVCQQKNLQHSKPFCLFAAGGKRAPGAFTLLLWKAAAAPLNESILHSVRVTNNFSSFCGPCLTRQPGAPTARPDSSARLSVV